VFLGKVGAGISREQLLAGKYDQYNMVFLILDSEDQYAGPAEILAAETCVTVRFCGSHKDAPAYYEKLAEYIKEQKLQITGFSKEITMIDFGLTNDPDQFVTEIQIPVCASSV
jgi:effector-binding domain-containing protein